jgi:hypothetical protein
MHWLLFLYILLLRLLHVSTLMCHLQGPSFILVSPKLLCHRDVPLYWNFRLTRIKDASWRWHISVETCRSLSNNKYRNNNQCIVLVNYTHYPWCLVPLAHVSQLKNHCHLMVLFQIPKTNTRLSADCWICGCSRGKECSTGQHLNTSWNWWYRETYILTLHQ